MKNFPSAEILIELEPEEIGAYLLVYLNSLIIENRPNRFHRYNETHPDNPEVAKYAGELKDKVGQVLAEGWQWLVSEGFLAPVPDENIGEFLRISRRGLKITSKEDFRNFEHLKLLPKGVLDPTLSQKVWASFIRGDFEIAIFAAFKEVEIRIRKSANLSAKEIGTDLARKAFHPDTGALTDTLNPDRGERQAYSDLFAGAIGAFKSPSSHKDVDYSDPIVVVSLIMHANMLLQIIEQRKSRK